MGRCLYSSYLKTPYTRYSLKNTYSTAFQCFVTLLKIEWAKSTNIQILEKDINETVRASLNAIAIFPG